MQNRNRVIKPSTFLGRSLTLRLFMGIYMFLDVLKKVWNECMTMEYIFQLRSRAITWSFPPHTGRLSVYLPWACWVLCHQRYSTRAPSWTLYLQHLSLCMRFGKCQSSMFTVLERISKTKASINSWYDLKNNINCWTNQYFKATH